VRATSWALLLSITPATSRIVKHGLQMRTTYSNPRLVLEQLGATLEDVVEEVINVTDMPAAFAVAGSVRKEAYCSDAPACASTIAEVKRLALPEQLIEMRLIAIVRE
jgi:enamine deaminase RidA (YjgF/YER057c/UK114 family)